MIQFWMASSYSSSAYCTPHLRRIEGDYKNERGLGQGLQFRRNLLWRGAKRASVLIT
jgi:hypothetical protein